MYELTEISLDSKKIFDEYFWKANYNISDLNFTNLYIWKDIYPIKYMMLDDFLCVFVEYNNNPPYVLMPAGKGDMKKVVQELICYFKAINIRFSMKGMTKELLDEVRGYFPDKFTFSTSKDIYDYVYSTENLIDLKGKKYHSKRNHINKFKSQYNYSYESLNKTNIIQCIEAAERWYENKGMSNGLDDERDAILLAFEHYDIFQYKGGLLKVDGEVIAFTIGELLSDEMAVIHIEKADSNYNGAYTMINQLFCMNEWSNTKYINREEDMGIEGLRKSKESYRPERLIDKYNICLKEEVDINDCKEGW